MAPMSKTKLMAYRQCPERLWLEIHKHDLREGSAANKASFAEAISPVTSAERKPQIHAQLFKYYRLDTIAIVRLWKFLSGRENFAS